MSTENPNAFPCYGDNPWGKPSTRAGGMSLRDYFAGKAMQAVLSTCDFDNAVIDARQLADDAYRVADAMLAERMK